jgi:hypothetical protein
MIFLDKYKINLIQEFFFKNGGLLFKEGRAFYYNFWFSEESFHVQTSLFLPYFGKMFIRKREGIWGFDPPPLLSSGSANEYVRY